MPQLSLSDYIDLVSSTSKAIRSIVAESEPSRPEFFTNAALRSELGELIREADPSEVGLFTLVPPSTYQVTSDNEAPANGTQITRVNLPSATPLKPVATKSGRDGKVKDHEPEVYANAALKYLDRYQSIQPMPRARSQAEHILEQLANVRQNIDKLNDKVKQHEFVDPTLSSMPPQDHIKDEEHKIEDLQMRVAELRKRKETLLAKRKPMAPQSSYSRVKLKPPSPPPPPPHLQEESFWNTPGPNLRKMNITGDLLLNENVDLDDISTASFGTPLPTRVSATPPTQLARTDETLDDLLDGGAFGAEAHDGTLQTTPTAPDPPPLQSPSPRPPQLQVVVPEPALQTPSTNGEPSSSKKHKLRITSDTEKIVAKIWATVGEIIMPGYQTNVVDGKAPRAKETIALLQSLCLKTPAPSSPSASNLSSFSSAPQSPSAQPTSQQILTAHLLIALLSSPPTYSMSLNKIKETLASGVRSGEAGGAVGGSLTHTRALYACVAKKLIKIERGKGEQVVKFDL